MAVNDVSFEVKAGQIVGLIGPNGAGKSTTFNLITGILGLSGGSVTYAGEALTGMNPRLIARRGIARTFQHAKILPTMSVLENVALGAHLRGDAGVLRSFLRLERKEEAPFWRKPPTSWSGSGLVHTRTGQRVISPSARSASWKLPVRCASIRHSCCSMNPQPACGMAKSRSWPIS